MSPKENMPSAAGSVVATAHTKRGLQQASKLRRRQVGFVELRLDVFSRHFPAVERASSAIAVPILITARHPREGGVGLLGAAKRRDLLAGFLSRADAVDIELRSVTILADVLRQARRQCITRVVSFHDFQRTPGLPRLREVVRRGAQAGADIVKIATHLRNAKDLALLLLLQNSAKVPLATMGMGPLGKVSRLVLAAAGSRLNYGYLDRPQVTGQWPALELVQRIEEVMP